MRLESVFRCLIVGLAAIGWTPLELAVAADSAGRPVCSDPAGVTVYLARHAEKLAGDDPGLTEAGWGRAWALAEALAEVPLTGVHVTEFKRTRQTAAPLALRKGIEPIVHEVRSTGLAAHVRGVAHEAMRGGCGGAVLVVGHSNTVPLIVAELSGRPEAEISELDYDFLYHVVMAGEGASTVVRTHYGAARRAAYRVAWVGTLHAVYSGDWSARMALSAMDRVPGLHAVGALAGLAGEVTVIDGQWSISRVSERSLVTSKEVGGEATLLVWAVVDHWRSARPLSQAVDDIDELEALIEAQAEGRLSDIERPFPFRIRARAELIDGHVLRTPALAEVDHRNASVRVRREDEPVELVGFFSEKHGGVFTHQARRIHLHARLGDGHGIHVDALRLAAGAEVLLPAGDDWTR